jgi:glycosyltransferase involved in cell wall biosynthesis
MKILMHYADWNYNQKRKVDNTYGGIGYYRTIKVAEQLKDHEITVWGKEILEHGDTLEEQWEYVFKNFDVFWTSYFADEHAAAAIYFMRDKHKKQVWIDLDDNYFDIPQSHEMFEEYKPGKRKRAILSTIISLADKITVSTEPLKQEMEQHFLMSQGIQPSITVIPNFNDINDWNYTPVPKYEDKIVVGYTGSVSHYEDVKLILPAMSKLMKKYKNLHLEFIGVVQKNKVQETFAGYGFDDDSLNRIAIVGATETFKEYPEWLSERPWDIGLAPLVDSRFTRSKSHIKWMEYSMYKIPTIASKVYPYWMELKGRRTIEHGRTGLLCKPSEWESAIEKLILDKELRLKLGENAYNEVKTYWQYKDSGIDLVVGNLKANG